MADLSIHVLGICKIDGLTCCTLALQKSQLLVTMILATKQTMYVHVYVFFFHRVLIVAYLPVKYTTGKPVNSTRIVEGRPNLRYSRNVRL